MAKCVLCEGVAKDGEYRCQKCDRAWQDGYTAGYTARSNEIKRHMQDMIGGDV